MIQGYNSAMSVQFEKCVSEGFSSFFQGILLDNVAEIKYKEVHYLSPSHSFILRKRKQYIV